jgi:acyl carrier protein
MDEIEKVLTDLITEYKGKPVAVTADTTFDDPSLAFDSLDKVDLLMRIEDKLEVAFGDDATVNTVGELVAKIKELKGIAPDAAEKHAPDLAEAVKTDVKPFVDKAYEKKSLLELAEAPVSAISGVSDGDAELLSRAFGVKTVRDFAELKYVKWAQAICAQAKGE